jgi:hypothetical protein
MVCRPQRVCRPVSVAQGWAHAVWPASGLTKSVILRSLAGCVVKTPRLPPPSFPGTLTCSNVAEFQKRLLLSSPVQGALPATGTLSWMRDLLNIEWSLPVYYVSEGGHRIRQGTATAQHLNPRGSTLQCQRHRQCWHGCWLQCSWVCGAVQAFQRPPSYPMPRLPPWSCSASTTPQMGM